MVLVLEDLSAWFEGADPVAAAGVLAGLHRRWEGQAAVRWPWLRRAGAAADLIEDLFGQVWPHLTARGDLSAPVEPWASAWSAGWPPRNTRPATRDR